MEITAVRERSSVRACENLINREAVPWTLHANRARAPINVAPYPLYASVRGFLIAAEPV